MAYSLTNKPSLSLLIIFFLFIINFSSISCQHYDHHHPLDPLTPSEFIQIQTLVEKAYSQSGHVLTFQYVGLDEPDKTTILSWAKLKPSVAAARLPPRRALVHARLDGKTLEIIVDLSTHSIVYEQKHYGTGYPVLTVEEQTVACGLPPKYGPFVESVKKRRLDLSQVACSAFTVGWYGEKNQRRVAKVQCFYTNGTVNLYVRPLEGILLVVDLDKMKIVEYHDRLRVPLPKAEGTEFRESKLRPPFGPHLNRLAIASPNGPGFTIQGHTIRFSMSILFIYLFFLTRRFYYFYYYYMGLHTFVFSNKFF